MAGRNTAVSRQRGETASTGAGKAGRGLESGQRTNSKTGKGQRLQGGFVGGKRVKPNAK